MREQQAATDEAVPRIEFDFAELGREEDHVLPIPSFNAVDVASESLSATLCRLRELLSRRRCCRRMLRALIAEVNTKRRHLHFGRGREKAVLSEASRAQYRDRPVALGVQDAAAPIPKRTGTVFRELAVETIRHLLALLPSIEVD